MNKYRMRQYWTSYGLIVGASIGILVSQITNGSLALLLVIGSALGLVAASIASLMRSRVDALLQVPASHSAESRIERSGRSEEIHDG